MSNKYLYLNGVMRGPVVDDDFMFQPEIVNDLPSTPIEGNHSFKENQVYEEGKDFALERKNIFHPPTKEPLGNTGALDASHGYYESTVAIPVDQSHNGKPDDPIYYTITKPELINAFKERYKEEFPGLGLDDRAYFIAGFLEAGGVFERIVENKLNQL